MIRFLHAADLHLDSPFRALSSEQAAQRRAELRTLPQTICELAAEQNCQIVLLAGDLFDAVGGYPETIEALQRAFRACPAKIFIAPGNHDFYSPASPYATQTWPENVHIFRSSELACVRVPELDCCIWGAAFQGDTAPALLEGFRVQDSEGFHLMVLHGDASTSASPYNPISEADIAASGLHYLALGHIHARSEAKQAGQTTYAWPGCPMGRGFDETGEKGVYLGTLTEQGCSLQFHALPSRRYEILSVAVGDDPLAAIETALASHSTQAHSYRIVLTGEANPIDARALYAALAPRFFSLALRDQTTPKADLWKEAGEDTLKGLLLAQLQTKWAASDADAKKTLELAARYARAALEGREVPEA